MTHATLLLAAVLAGVDTGWQPVEDGGLEYIIQIDPLLMESLRAGESLTSEIPAALRGVRRYRIVIGTEPLPRIGNPPEPTPHPEPDIELDPLPDRPSNRDPAPAEPAPNEDTRPPVRPPLRERASSDQRQQSTDPPRMPSRYDPPPVLDPPAPTKQAPGSEPAAFDPGPSTEALSNRVADFKEPSRAAKSRRPQAAPSSPLSAPAAPSKPWLPFTLSLFGLVASLGANVYLAWIWLDTRRRYQQLIHERQ